MHDARVYVCRKALIGTEAVAKLCPRVFYLHRAVGIETKKEKWICDFLPFTPRDPRTLVRVLSLQDVKGRLRLRRVDALSRLRYYVGSVEAEGIEEAVRDFNHHWDPRLKLFEHDCWSYAAELRRHLLDPVHKMQKEVEETRH